MSHGLVWLPEPLGSGGVPRGYVWGVSPGDYHHDDGTTSEGEELLGPGLVA